MLYGGRDLVAPGLGIKRQTHIFPIAMVVAVAVNFILMYILVPSIGASGAAIALLSGNIFLCVTRLYFGQKIYPLKFEWKRLTKLSIITLALFAAGTNINFQNIVLDILFKFPFVIFGFPLMMIMFSFFSEEEKGHVRSLFVNLYNWIFSLLSPKKM